MTIRNSAPWPAKPRRPLSPFLAVTVVVVVAVTAHSTWLHRRLFFLHPSLELLAFSSIPNFAIAVVRSVQRRRRSPAPINQTPAARSRSLRQELGNTSFPTNSPQQLLPSCPWKPVSRSSPSTFLRSPVPTQSTPKSVRSAVAVASCRLWSLGAPTLQRRSLARSHARTSRWLNRNVVDSRNGDGDGNAAARGARAPARPLPDVA